MGVSRTRPPPRAFKRSLDRSKASSWFGNCMNVPKSPGKVSLLFTQSSANTLLLLKVRVLKDGLPSPLHALYVHRLWWILTGCGRFFASFFLHRVEGFRHPGSNQGRDCGRQLQDPDALRDPARQRLLCPRVSNQQNFPGCFFHFSHGLFLNPMPPGEVGGNLH